MVSQQSSRAAISHRMLNLKSQSRCSNPGLAKLNMQMRNLLEESTNAPNLFRFCHFVASPLRFLPLHKALYPPPPPLPVHTFWNPWEQTLLFLSPFYHRRRRRRFHCVAFLSPPIALPPFSKRRGRASQATSFTAQKREEKTWAYSIWWVVGLHWVKSHEQTFEPDKCTKPKK